LNKLKKTKQQNQKTSPPFALLFFFFFVLCELQRKKGNTSLESCVSCLFDVFEQLVPRVELLATNCAGIGCGCRCCCFLCLTGL
jgi:hypothetical protein